MKPELERFGEELWRLRDRPISDEEYERELIGYRENPLFTEYAEALLAQASESTVANLKAHGRGLEKDRKPNLPMQLMCLTEEMADIHGTSPEDNITWHTAKDAGTAYLKMLEAKRLLKLAQRRFGEAEATWAASLVGINLELAQRGLRPFQGTRDDPTIWFLTIDEVSAIATKQLNWEITPSQIRYYSRIGLIPKAIRVGEKGRALYPITTLLRIFVISRGQQRGESLSEIKATMAQKVKDIAIDMAKEQNSEFNFLARMIDPRLDRLIREVLRALQGKPDEKSS